MRRKFLLWFSGILVGFAAVVYLLPALVSGPALPWLVSKVNDALPGAVQIDRLALSWSGPQHLEGLVLYDPEGVEVFHVADIEARQSLWSLLLAPHCAGTVTVDGLRGHFVALADGTNNVQRAVAPPDAGGHAASDAPPSAAPLPATLRCRLEISGGEWQIGAPDIETIHLTGLAGHLDVRGGEAIDGVLHARIGQGDRVGAVDTEVKIAAGSGAGGTLDFATAQIAAEATLSAFPVELLEALAGGTGSAALLLGHEVDAELHADYRNGSGQARLALTGSGGAAAAVTFEMADGRLTAAPDSRLMLTVTPERWQALAGPDPVLAKPFTTRLDISELTLPLADPGAATLRLHASLSDVEMQAAQAGKLALRGTEIDVLSAGLRDDLAVTFVTRAEQRGRRGTADLKATLRQWLDEHLALTAERMQIDVAGRIGDLPLAVFDELLRQDGLLVALLGESLSAEIQSTIEAGGQGGSFTVQAASRHLEAALGGALDSSGLRLNDGGRLEWNAQPAAVSRLSEGLKLAAPARLAFAIERFAVPRQDSGFDWSGAAFSAGIQAAQLDLRAGQDGGLTRVRALRAKVQTARLADSVDLALAAQIDKGPVNAAMRLQAVQLGAGFALGRGSVLALNAAPAALAPFVPDALRPASELHAEIAVNRLQWPATGPAAGSIDVTASIPELALAGERGAAALALHDTAVHLTGETIGRKLNIDLTSTLTRGKEQGSVTLDAELNGVPDAPAVRRAQLAARNIPASIAAALTGQGAELAGLFGDKLDAEMTIAQGSGADTDFALTINAERLRAEAKGRYSDRQFALDPGTAVDLNLSPEAARRLLPETWRLQRPANAQLRLQKLAVGRTRDGDVDYRTLQIGGTFKTPELILQGGDAGYEYPLRNLALAIDSPRLADGATLDLNATLPVPAGTSANEAAGRLRGKVTVRELLDRSGGIDMAAAAVSADIRADQVSSDLVMAFAGQDPALAEALGPAVSASFAGAVPGDFTFHVAGRNTRVAVAGNIDRGRTLRLTDDAQFELNVTPRLVEAYLSKMHPFLREVSSSEKPIRLTVQGNGFALPLDRYAPQAIASRGRLEIGTLLMHRGPLTGAFTSAMQVMGSPVVNRQTFPAVFTPLEFSVADGVIRTNDLWMTMDNLMLGSQARLHLPETTDGKLFAEVLFAVPGQTLWMIPKIAQQVPADELYLVSDSGPIDELSPDFSKLFGSVVAQSAASTLAEATGRSELGSVFGLLGRAMRQPKKTASQPQAPTIEGWAGATWPNRPPIEGS